MSGRVLYGVGSFCAGLVIPRFGTVQVTGREHVPASGGALLLPNHQSMFDPFLVQSNLSRPVRSMTKSTQFASSFMAWIVPRLGGFPVRRYRVDAQAVRTTIRLMREGEIVCIYPEGERSWDGRLQSFRRGALRVALAAVHHGIPVLPVGISGMYDVFPRWGRPKRSPNPLRLTFGEPLAIGPFKDRRSRDAALPELRALLRERLLVLSGEA